MNLSRCENGHFYDREKYATCPHCSQGASQDDSMTTVFTEDLNEGPDISVTFDNGGVTPVSKTETAPAEGNRNGIPVQDVTETVAGNVAGNMAGNMPGNMIGKIISDNTMSANNFEQDDDHTQAFYDDLFVTPSNETQSVSTVQSPRVTTPCTGWLIATSGVHIGQDFRLKAGKNFVGRDSSMDIVLDGEKSVSRKRHAIVVYEPKQHLYLVQPGESSELVYLNNEVVLSPKKLTEYDVITVGEVNLLFIPLCGEQFNWNEILLKK